VTKKNFFITLTTGVNVNRFFSLLLRGERINNS
jgi:hypothetical protein